MIGAITPGKLIVLGTRWIPGGSVVNWPKRRQYLSRAGTAYAKLALGIPLNDLTGGFRVYSVDLLKALKLSDMQATGYCYQIEMALAAHLAGAKEIEVPITFVERINGVSKMSQAIVIEALLQTTRWGITRIIRPNADKLHYVKLSELRYWWTGANQVPIPVGAIDTAYCRPVLALHSNDFTADKAISRRRSSTNFT